MEQERIPVEKVKQIVIERTSMTNLLKKVN
jgi:hypothetical protein